VRIEPGERNDGEGAEQDGIAHAFKIIPLLDNRQGRHREQSGHWQSAEHAEPSVLLLAVASVTTSQWLGMFSALPVPGLFAVATLSIIEKRDYFERMRDTVLLGPLSVIPFNWLYAHVVTQLPSGTLPRLADGIIAMALLMLA